jgi:uncharacterized membrane protein YkoI
MRKSAVALLGAALAIGSTLFAQQPAPPQANIMAATRARDIALASVPDNFGILSETLKTKDGLVVYEFDIRTAGKGHQEVRVDAVTGAVVSNHHEKDLVHAPIKFGGQSRPDTVVFPDSAIRRAAFESLHPNISELRAREIAEQALPNAPVISVQLVKKDALFIWKIRMKAQTDGDEEVWIDANTGTVLSQTHVDNTVTRTLEKIKP